MKLGVVMCMWRREEVAELALRRIKRAAGDLPVRLVAVTDEPVNGNNARAAGWEVVNAPNRPLSNKHNAGALHLRNAVDALIIVGSDNWVCDRFFGRWIELLETRPTVGVVDSYQVCVYRPEALHWPGYPPGQRHGEAMGVGRGLRKDVLEKLDWRPWPADYDGGMDRGMRKKLETAGYSIEGTGLQDDLGVRVLGVKTRNEDLNPFKIKLARRPDRVRREGLCCSRSDRRPGDQPEVSTTPALSAAAFPAEAPTRAQPSLASVPILPGLF